MLVKKSETSPEMAAREMEKKVNSLIEESAIATVNGDPKKGLEKAKDAQRRVPVCGELILIKTGAAVGQVSRNKWNFGSNEPRFNICCILQPGQPV